MLQKGELRPEETVSVHSIMMERARLLLGHLGTSSHILEP